MSVGINEGIRRLATLGCVSFTSVMPNMPCAYDIARLREHAPWIAVGVHLNLTEGKPLSRIEKVHSLVGETGDFLPPTRLLRKSFRGRVSLKECRLELENQIAWGTRFAGGRIDHWNSD
jgi:predicted glycoside hydrolase/deacetylase ChbG (UPF0249 family)